MKPVEFEEQNTIFRKPESMTDEQCQSLPAWRGKDQDGLPVITSCWKLSDEELKTISETKQVWLGIVGHVMPPVYLTFERPFIVKTPEPNEIESKNTDTILP